MWYNKKGQQSPVKEHNYELNVKLVRFPNL